MDAEDARTTADELRLMARARPQWKPTLHRAARMIEKLIPADQALAPGRYGGRKLPPAFPKRQVEDLPVQPDLILSR